MVFFNNVLFLLMLLVNLVLWWIKKFILVQIIAAKEYLFIIRVLDDYRLISARRFIHEHLFDEHVILICYQLRLGPVEIKQLLEFIDRSNSLAGIVVIIRLFTYHV